MERQPRASAAAISRRWPLYSGLAAIGVAFGLGVLVLVRQNQAFSLDSEWMEEILENRAWWWEVPALIMDALGGGWFAIYVVPAATIVALLLVRKRWAALYYAIAAALSVAAVQGLKALFDRPRPEEMLITSDIGSFPSGHVANAATIAVALGVILSRTWVWVLGAAYVVLMALSRTYLGVHWASDTIGGALIGAGIAVMVWVPFAHRLNRERQGRSSTDSVPADL